MSVVADPNIVLSGLVLCLDAANPKSYPGSGTTWTDVSGNGNNGTLTNGPTYSSADGGSLVFNGSTTYVTVPDSPLLSFTNNIFTFDYWVKFNTVASIGVLGKMTTWEYAFRSSTSGVLQFITWNLSGTQVYASPSTPSTNVSTSTWYHHLSTADGTTNTIYVNGVLVATATRSTNTMGDGTNPLILGAGGDAGGWKYLDGNLSTVKIYNRYFSAAEAAQNFNALRGRYGI